MLCYLVYPGFLATIHVGSGAWCGVTQIKIKGVPHRIHESTLSIVKCHMITHVSNPFLS